MVVGAPYDDRSSSVYNAESAYMFTRSASGVWSQRAKLTATDGSLSDHCDLNSGLLEARSEDVFMSHSASNTASCLSSHGDEFDVLYRRAHRIFLSYSCDNRLVWRFTTKAND